MNNCRKPENRKNDYCDYVVEIVGAEDKKVLSGEDFGKMKHERHHCDRGNCKYNVGHWATVYSSQSKIEPKWFEDQVFWVSPKTREVV